MKVAQLCPILCDPMDYKPMGILQARIQQWVALPLSKRSSQPSDQNKVPTLQTDSLPTEPPGKPQIQRAHY